MTSKVVVSKRKLFLAFVSIALVCSMATGSLVYVSAQGGGGGYILLSGSDSIFSGNLSVGGTVNASSFVFNNGTTLGATGPAGSNGSNGANGTNGTNGSNGVNGNNGLMTCTYLIDTFTNATNTYYRAIRGNDSYIAWSSTNAATVINNAYISASLVKGSIWANPGDYYISSSIQAKANVALEGTWGAIFHSANNLNNATISILGQDNVTISGIQIDGNRINQDTESYPTKLPCGIFVADSNNVQILNNYIHDCREHGIWLITVSKSMSGGLISGNTLDYAIWNGITIGAAAYAWNNTITVNNHVGHSSDVGISVFGYNNLVDSNVITNMHTTMGGQAGGANGGWGLGVEYGSGYTGDNIFSNNIISDCNEGIVLESAGNSVLGGSITNSSDNALRLTGQGSYSTIKEVTFKNWASRAIDLLSSYNTIQQNNFITTTNPTYGVDIEISNLATWNIISENQFTDLTAFTYDNAIKLNGSNNATIQANTFNGAFYTAIDMILCNSTNIVDNTFNGVNISGVNIYLENANVKWTWINNNNFYGQNNINSGIGTTYGNNRWADGTYDTTPP